jgi:uncharacterized membrane protein
MLQAIKYVDGRVLSANLHLLFWLSLFPFAIAWTGENQFAPREKGTCVQQVPVCFKLTLSTSVE